MSMDAIKSITDAEEDARRAKLSATRAAKERIEDAEQAGAAVIADIIQRAEAENMRLLRAAEKNAAEKAKELASKTAKRQATIVAHAEARLDDAARLIVERIVSG